MQCNHAALLTSSRARRRHRANASMGLDGLPPSIALRSSVEAAAKNFGIGNNVDARVYHRGIGLPCAAAELDLSIRLWKQFLNSQATGTTAAGASTDSIG
ncbi:unnamed protein product [Vitrella brassicaformis CCMP3155]|uniref:Uncharacterized protein n=1 Tax=Vitrella brassicaformis (strain CCMP3155) TaxID=1169540 RepID=A0A0G4ECR7_VITBC|nr:unnamed protein product [Vitrella brassicaformis CCMP3155]|eukprot:CEL93339.1 unnamed protein product [Vitrella brassicaformis CCMP3155]